MNRRTLGVLGVVAAFAAACAAPEPSGEPQSMIAFLRAVAVPGSATERAMLIELRRAGYVEGRNLQVFGRGDDEAYPDPVSARDAVEAWAAQGTELIIAFSSSGALAAAESALDANVLFISNEPVAAGLLRDEQRPDGRMTGVTFRVPADRTLDLARRAISGLERVGLAYPPSDPAATPHRDATAAAAAELGLELRTQEFDDALGVGAAVARLAADGVQALVMSNSPTAIRNMTAFEEAYREHRIPVVANTDVVSFALLALYPDGEALGRQLGRQAVRLLRGVGPASVPVEDPRRFGLVLDQDVASELGIELPESVILEADRVRGGDR